jgi:hypothetical protein
LITAHNPVASDVTVASNELFISRETPEVTLEELTVLFCFFIFGAIFFLLRCNFFADLFFGAIKFLTCGIVVAKITVQAEQNSIKRVSFSG